MEYFILIQKLNFSLDQKTVKRAWSFKTQIQTNIHMRVPSGIIKQFLFGWKLGLIIWQSFKIIYFCSPKVFAQALKVKCYCSFACRS